MDENTNPLFGKPWTDHSVHNTHPEALSVKEGLESDTLQVKIRRTAEEKFRVKTRHTVVVESKSTKTSASGPPKTRSARRKEKAARHKARQEKG